MRDLEEAQLAFSVAVGEAVRRAADTGYSAETCLAWGARAAGRTVGGRLGAGEEDWVLLHAYAGPSVARVDEYCFHLVAVPRSWRAAAECQSLRAEAGVPSVPGPGRPSGTGHEEEQQAMQNFDRKQRLHRAWGGHKMEELVK